MPRLSLAVALGVGVGGALVDLSSYARLTDGLSRRWGRDDAFYGVEPGTFSFTLDNADGRFTPENPSSPLDTTLTEGMLACVQVGSRLTGGTVRRIEPAFPGGDAAWALVRVTCEDSLGELSRVPFDGDLLSAVSRQQTGGYWPMDDPAGSSFALNVVDSVRPMRSGALTFGEPPIPGSTVSQALLSIGAGQTATMLAIDDSLPADISDDGWWNFWITPLNDTGYLQFVDGNGVSYFGVRNGAFTFFAVPYMPFNVGQSYFVSFRGGGNFTDFYINGELLYSSTTMFPLPTTGSAVFFVGDPAFGVSSFRFSRMSLSLDRVEGELVGNSTTAQRITLIAEASPGTTFATPPTSLSPARLGEDTASNSMLDALNTVMFTEQGDVYTSTTGTLTSPTTSINVRERTRPETVTATFNVEDELDGAPSFVRDITNLVSRVTVTGPNGETGVIDATLTARIGNAASTETVLLSADMERRMWGQDRLQRGANTKMRIASVVVDAMTTPTDRSADLLALIPGDRVQFTNLPSTVLGFDTWDGWFLGASEQHDISSHQFTLHFTPVLPDTAVYDTDRFMADEELTLSGAINNSVTSITVASVGALLSTTETPYTIQFDDEQMTVTAVTGASSPQTVTVTRGVNGTTAASHSDGAVLVSAPDSLYAF